MVSSSLRHNVKGEGLVRCLKLKLGGMQVRGSRSFEWFHLESTMSDGPHEGWAVEHCQWD